MKPPGIRGRLTAWYSLILALSLAAFCCVAYLVMAYSFRRTVQSELMERSEGVRDILVEDGPQGRAALKDELSEFANGLGSGGRLRVTDSGGSLFASPGMANPTEPSSLMIRRTWREWMGGAPFLLLRQNLVVSGTSYDVTMAVATSDFDRTLRRGSTLLFAAAPIFLAFAALGGYWMSRRALMPVDQMTQAARSISALDLGRRLAVPPARDELGRLADTLNQMLARLEAAFRRVAQFTADASHELRTPVAVMRTSAEIALRKPRSESEYRNTLSQVVQETDKISRLIENLLELARADSGAAQMHMERTDLSAILAGCCDESKLLAAKQGVTLSRNGADTSIWVNANAAAIERLFMIVLDNAMKYTPSGGRVEVQLNTINGFAVAEIRDTGIGISAEDISHIFDRFYRADPARSRETGGSGLGLAIAKWIAEAHDGAIEVHSTIGRGSVFEIRLPLGQHEAPVVAV
jgi:heavy metal sensor kinase